MTQQGDLRAVKFKNTVGDATEETMVREDVSVQRPKGSK
jgi:hypothetical protein